RRSIRRGRASSPRCASCSPTERAARALPPAGRRDLGVPGPQAARALDRAPRQGRDPRLHRLRLLRGHGPPLPPPARLGRRGRAAAPRSLEAHATTLAAGGRRYTTTLATCPKARFRDRPPRGITWSVENHAKRRRA